MTEHLSEAHRTTLGHLDRHPTTHNLEWHDVRSLLEAVGDVTEEHNGKVRVTVGDQTLTITPPRHRATRTWMSRPCSRSDGSSMPRDTAPTPSRGGAQP